MDTLLRSGLAVEIQKSAKPEFLVSCLLWGLLNGSVLAARSRGLRSSPWSKS